MGLNSIVEASLSAGSSVSAIMKNLGIDKSAASKVYYKNVLKPTSAAALVRFVQLVDFYSLNFSK